MLQNISSDQFKSGGYHINWTLKKSKIFQPPWRELTSIFYIYTCKYLILKVRIFQFHEENIIYFVVVIHNFEMHIDLGDWYLIIIIFWDVIFTFPLGKPRSLRHCITIFSVLPDAKVLVMLQTHNKKQTLIKCVGVYEVFVPL